MATFAGLPPNGVWKLRVNDRVAGNMGVIGCMWLDISHLP